MTLVFRDGEAAFAEAARLLHLTPGNLDAHANKLAAAGWLERRRVLAGDKFAVLLRITPDGNAAFREYLARLQAFLATVDS